MVDLGLPGCTPQGLRPADLVARHQVQQELRLSAAATLLDLSADWLFFNHGVLLLWGRLEIDPVVDLINRLDLPAPAILDLPVPILTGLGTDPEAQAWMHRLVAVQREGGERLLDELGGVAAVDRSRRTFVRANRQLLEIPDPYVMAGHAHVWPIPVAPVTFFGLECARYSVNFSAPVMPAGVRISKLPPNPATVEMAAKVLNQHPNPLS